MVVGDGEHDFASALATILHSNDRVAAMGSAGEAYAREHLNWDNIARRFGELYQEMRDGRVVGDRQPVTP
jgi:glycosyltransferase involved in cell wall biosynthesis